MLRSSKDKRRDFFFFFGMTKNLFKSEPLRFRVSTQLSKSQIHDPAHKNGVYRISITFSYVRIKMGTLQEYSVALCCLNIYLSARIYTCLT